jgi:hypothetical protein
MAKLDVKVTDMVGGEVTKVTYEGAEYARVSSASELDIIRPGNSSLDVTEGAFYPLEKVYNDGDVRIYDNVDDGHDLSKRSGFIPFRKITAQASPTLETRVETLEKDAAELKAQAKWSEIGRKPNEFKKGDIVTAKDVLGDKYRYYGEVEAGPIGYAGGGNYEIKRIGSKTFTTLGEHVQLITPVEARFDKDEV